MSRMALKICMQIFFLFGLFLAVAALSTFVHKPIIMHLTTWPLLAYPADKGARYPRGSEMDVAVAPWLRVTADAQL